MTFINKEKAVAYVEEQYRLFKGDDDKQAIVEGCVEALKFTPIANVMEIPTNGIGELSDGYHTFNELYHHRAVLFLVICNLMPDKAWKSKFHHEGDMFDNMFVVGIETPNGQATYHYHIEPYWDMFKIQELERAPKWDGHTPTEAINRIATLSNNAMEVVRCKKCEYHHWEQEPCHGKTEHFCSKLNTQIPRDFYCGYGKKE